MQDTLTIPEEVQTEQAPLQQDPPSKKLYDGLVKEHLYTKTYEEFTKQFSNPEAIQKLHKGLAEEQLYTKGSDDFTKQYFPDVKKKVGSNVLPTPSDNGLSSTPKAEKQIVPAGQLPQVKSTLADFGIKASVIPKEQDVNQPTSTEAVQPKITASYADFRDHNDEIVAKKSKLKDEAIDNAARKVLKNKGVIKPEEDGKALNLSQYQQLTTEKKRLTEAVASGDATVGISKDGEVGLKKTLGFWDSLTKGWNESMKGNDEAAAFADMDASQKVDFLKQKQAESDKATPSEYIGERPSAVGSLGKLAGENAPFLVKAAEGTATGAALIAAAPETLGASLAGLPAATAFIFTANDAKNQGIQSEVTRRFYQLKKENPEANEVDLMKQAEQGTLAGGLAGIGMNAAMMSSVKTPLSNMAKGVVSKSISKAVGNAVYGGAVSAGIEGAKMAEGNLEGIKATPTDIAKHMGTTFAETASTLGILHVMAGAVTKALTLPNVVKSAFKYALSEANPTELQNTLKVNEDAGKIPEGTTEKVMTDLDQYKAALSKTPNGLSPEAEASVAGLIQAKDKLTAEMKTKDDTAKPFYEEKIEGINEQIQKTVNTGKPYAHEIDEISGDKYTTKPEPSDEIKVGELLDKPITYKGEPATLAQDGQTLIAKLTGKDKEYELGNINELKDKPISDYSIEHETSVVGVDDNGNIKVRDESYVNNFSDPLKAINRDENGNVVSVNLETSGGKKRTFRGNIAEDVAYQIHLKEINKNDETRTRFEQFINEDAPTSKKIEDAGLSKTTTKTAVENNEQIPPIKSETTVEPTKLEQERDAKIKEVSTPKLQKLEYIKESELVKQKNETELIEEQRDIKKREGMLRSLIKCLTA